MDDVRRASGSTGLVVASTFAGCGGSSTGYRLAGFDVRYANELDRWAADAYALNMSEGTTLDRRDVRAVSGEDIARACDQVPDVLDGSPPCQDFSHAGRRDLDGERASLYYEFVRLVGELRPLAFVAENVLGFAEGRAYGRHFLPILAAVRGHGYDVAARKLDASWLGVPQTRRRVVLIGMREDLGIGALAAFPSPDPRQTRIVDALPGVLRLLRRADEDVRAEHWVWRRERTWPASGPAPTITAGFQEGKLFVEPRDGRDPRALSLEEVAALCGFPSGFAFPEGMSDARRWKALGNSVPPPMARRWAEGVRDLLLGVPSEASPRLQVGAG
jgi:DNA (cytosine-5)-methyltransferase 1